MRTVINILVLIAGLAGGVILPQALAAEELVTNSVAPASTNVEYTLNTQDRLIYLVEEDPVKAQDVDLIGVNAAGDASFRVSRGSDMTITLKARGRTVADLRRELKEKLDGDFYQDAHVKLELKDSAPKFGQVLFIGKGSRGNMLQLAPGEEKRIFEAVYQVGVNEFANLKKVKLQRVDPVTQKATTRVVDLEEIRRGNRTNNVVLQNGDIIDVPEKGFVIN
ncbi:MAG: hypothetical protein WCO56_01135 [Verrucomicrobiota bacterium]